MKEKFKTGLVLSGGSARGVAHLGVMKALNEAGIYPDVISGTSAGSLAGVFYADGYTPDEILEFFLEKRLYHFVRPALPTEGFLHLNGFEELLEENLSAKTFRELDIPLFVTVTNFNKGQVEYIHEGPLIPYVIASSSIPVLFTPKIINGTVYIDGGVMDNFPVQPLLGKCERIIGVHVNPIGEVTDSRGIMRLAERAFQLSTLKSFFGKEQYLDLLIEPEELKDYRPLEVSRAQEMFDAGYHAAKKSLKEKSLH